MLIEEKPAPTAPRKPLPAHDPLVWSPAAVAARKDRSSRRSKEGRVGWVFLWLLGIPLPILFGAYFLRGCT
jgi:hypothetical protein